jgi:putative ABC transport system permease protein
VLAIAGGALGLALGWAGTHVLVRLQPRDMLRVHEFGVDASEFAYVLAITMTSALIFGVAPALWARHRNPADSLKDGRGGGAQTARGKRWGDLLVVSEVALALLMTVGAGLLVRSFYQMQRVDPGFDPHGVLVAAFSSRRSRPARATTPSRTSKR